MLCRCCVSGFAENGSCHRVRWICKSAHTLTHWRAFRTLSNQCLDWTSFTTGVTQRKTFSSEVSGHLVLRGLGRGALFSSKACLAISNGRDARGAVNCSYPLWTSPQPGCVTVCLWTFSWLARRMLCIFNVKII